jgi:hypothetical protein
MQSIELLSNHLQELCPTIHGARMNALLDVVEGLQLGGRLTLTSMGRHLQGKTSIKHKIKKVDRLEGNHHLHKELSTLYEGMSDYIFKYVHHEVSVPIVVDLCYIQDNRAVQMLSAEVAIKGRSIPLYREVFKSGELKGRARDFLEHLAPCLPQNVEVILIMDAGFGEDWFQAIESKGWYWLSRIRQGKNIKLTPESDWGSIKTVISNIGVKAKSYEHASIMVKHNHLCRVITKKNPLKNTKANYRKQPRNYHAGNGDYSRSAMEPWILATNLPKSSYTATKVISYYAKRMQIEESFRDIKSHQFGLGARYARTENIDRWGVKMLLSAIVQVVYWIIGVIGHSQGYQRKFQSNTVKNKKVFSYFYLGRLIVEHDMLHKISINYKTLQSVINNELERQW